MSKKIRAVLSGFLLMVFCLLLLVSCGTKNKQNENFIYYLNGEMTSLVKESYQIGSKGAQKEAEKMLKAMAKQPENIERCSVFPEGVKLKGVSLDGEELLVDVNSAYLEADVTRQVLFQAAVVQSLVQIQGIDGVGFSVEGEGLKDEDGSLVGYLTADNFVQNVGSALHSYQTATLTLYFANEAGDGLVKKKVDVKYSSNVSMEKLIVSQVIKGPDNSSTQAVAAVNPATKVLGVTSEEGICYINLDEGFLENTTGVKPEVAVYALVNSVIEGTEEQRVQISINGESKIQYMDAIDLSQPLAENTSLESDSGK